MKVWREWRSVGPYKPQKQVRMLHVSVLGFNLNLRVLFDPRVLWVGVYWTPSDHTVQTIDVYVCLLPMVPLVAEVSWYARSTRRRAQIRKTT